MQKMVTDEGAIINNAALDLSSWHQTSDCSYEPGTEVAGEGWRCRTGWFGNLAIEKSSEAQAIVDQFGSSGLFTLDDKIDVTQIGTTKMNVASYAMSGLSAPTKITTNSCELSFGNDDSVDIKVAFECTDSAIASWYPNTELDTMAPGINAYKQ